MSDTASSSPTGTPTIKRRLMVMVYETFLLLAVEMLAVALYLLVTRNSHAPLAQHGLKAFLFLITGAYFVWCWTDSGHTLAMKTWRLRLTANGQGRVPLKNALLRYLLAWGWFLPALVFCGAFGLKDKAQVAAAVAAGVIAWGLTAFLDKDRQFLHDRLAGTRLVQMPKAASPAAAAPAASLQ
jgi:uncharacterized RDD family membrane protein YckC